MLYTIIKLCIDFGTYFYFIRFFKRENIYLANRILNDVRSGGNVFWKLSQWICSRVEFQYDLPDNYLINELKKFYDKCPAHDFSISREIIERFYGKKINDIFSCINTIPIASGSIGQVYEAIMKNGEKVAIKIRHPNIRENIIKLCNILSYIPKNYLQFDLSGLDYYLLHQTDFKKEYYNLDKLNNKFKNNSYIKFPKPIAADDDIIVMEYIDGENIDEYYNKSKLNNDNKHWDIMVKFWMFIRESILLKNFCHADLHKGNWKIKDDKIIIYDLGIIISNHKHFDDYKKIWEGFEARQPKVLAPLLIKNIVNIENVDNIINIEERFINFMEENIDLNALHFSGDIKLIIQFINKEGCILKFHMISYLISFYLAMSNFKNFTFTKNNKSYIEGHLEILNILKDKCDIYNNKQLKKRILIDEELFIDHNKDRLKEIFKKRDEIDGIDEIEDLFSDVDI